MDYQPEEPPEMLKQMLGAIEDTQRERADKRKMRGEATALALRDFLDKLAADKEQMGTFTSLMAGLMAEGKHNYLTAMVYGMAVAKTWEHFGFEQLLPKEDVAFPVLEDASTQDPFQSGLEMGGG